MLGGGEREPIADRAEIGLGVEWSREPNEPDDNPQRTNEARPSQHLTHAGGPAALACNASFTKTSSG